MSDRAIDLAIQKQLWSATGPMTLQLNLMLSAGSLVAFYGKSGAGKTSLLRILAGLLKPDQGRIVIQGDVWFDANARIHLTPQQRKVGLLFQDYALFPNMTVQENLRFALVRGESPKMIRELIEIMELGELRHQKPAALSGGQKQRVALARALVQRPKLLMLDEPLSALDAEMRSKLQQYILRVHREFGLTTILVSHDVAEVSMMADEVLLLESGKVTKRGSPTEVLMLASPRSRPFERYDARQYPTVDVVTGYREWAKTYDQTVYQQLDIPLLARLKSVPWMQLQRAVDLGCGTGRMGQWLQQQGVKQIEGVDCTAAMVEIARAKNIYARIEISDISQTGLETGRYDLVISSLALCHVEDLRGLYAEVARLLQPGGFFVLLDYHPFFLLQGIPTHFDRLDGESIAIKNFVHLMSEHVITGRQLDWTLLEMQERIVDEAWVRQQPGIARHLHRPISFCLLWQL